MKTSDIMHPDDAKALQMLRKIKGFDKLVRKFMEFVEEREFRGENLGDMVKVTDENFHELHESFKRVVKVVGINEPELYIYNAPEMNAYTYGIENTFIAISSGMLERMNREETECIIAHECGHILCQHTFYTTLLLTLEKMGLFFEVITYTTLAPILMALHYWNRKSELSADRCAAVVSGERVFQQSMLKLACGLREIKRSPYQLVEQARQYKRFEKGSWWNRIQQNWRIAYDSHPPLVLRAWEIDRWKHSYMYRRLRNQ